MDLADHLEAAVPDRQREWYQAWLAGWGKLGGTDPNAMLGRGAGVRGLVYEEYQAMWLAEPAQSAEAYVGERWPDIQAAAGFARAWLDVVLLSGIDTSVMNLGTTPLALGGPLYVEWTSEWRSADRSAYDPVEWIPEFDQWTPEFEFLAANWPSVATAAGISLGAHPLFRPTRKWHLYYQGWLLPTPDDDTVLALAALPSEGDDPTAFRAAYELWRRDGPGTALVGNDFVPAGSSWTRGAKAQVLTNFKCEAETVTCARDHLNRTGEFYPVFVFAVVPDGRWRTQVADRRGERTAQTYGTAAAARAGHGRWIAESQRR
jgi:hypothetical protein